jgi:flagellar basal-body rod modification protein FlgD
MTAVAGIGIVGSSTTSTPSGSLNISQQDFLSILLTQLQYQDPLQPMDDQAFLGQLAQFSALEVATQESAQLDNLITFNSMNQAIALLGKTVAVNESASSGASSSTSASGTVSAVNFSTGAPLLTVTTSSKTLTDVALSSVTLIQQ